MDIVLVCYLVLLVFVRGRGRAVEEGLVCLGAVDVQKHRGGRGRRAVG